MAAYKFKDKQCQIYYKIGKKVFLNIIYLEKLFLINYDEIGNSCFKVSGVHFQITKQIIKGYLKGKKNY